jgi:hypothetical protein
MNNEADNDKLNKEFKNEVEKTIKEEASQRNILGANISSRRQYKY